MTIGEGRELIAYDKWANALVFGAVGGLSGGQLRRSVASSFPSVGATLGHIVGAEWLWLRRWRGESPGSIPAWAAEPEVADLRSRLTAVEAERDAFLADLCDADLERVVSYRTIAGQAHADPLGNLVRHVVNHSTYHRGQVATQLRQFGLTPPSTDLIAYLWQVK